MLAATFLALICSPQTVPLEVGKPVSAALGSTASRVHTPNLDANFTRAPTLGVAYSVEVETAGLYSIDSRSYDFDTYLVLSDGSGKVLGEDDDGWIRTHSRLTLALEPGRSYTLYACALHGGRGSFEVVVRAGAVDPLPEEQRWQLEAADLHGRIQYLEQLPQHRYLDEAQTHQDLGALYYRRQMADQALEQWDRALELYPQASGGPFYSEANLNRALSMLWEGKGDLVRAIAHARARLQITAQVVGKDDFDFATAETELGALLKAAGEYSEAVELFENAVTGYQEALGGDHEYTVIALKNLLSLNQGLDRAEQVVAVQRRILGIQERTMGADHPQRAQRLNSLAFYLHQRGDHQAALPYYQQALAIRERSLGAEHADTALSLNNLAFLLEDLGRPEEALPHYLRGLAILDAEGQTDVSFLRDLSTNLGNLLMSLGRIIEAESHFLRAVDLLELEVGADDPRLLNELNLLGSSLGDLGAYVIAENLMRRALAIRRRTLETGDVLLAPALNNLAIAATELGKYQEARACYEEALQLNIQHYGPEHQEVSAVLGNLAQLYEQQGLLETARPLSERALAISIKAFGAAHPQTARDRINLGILLKDQGLYGEAQPLLETALADLEAALDPQDPFLATALSNLANLYASMTQWDAAYSLLKRALDLRQAVSGLSHPETVRTRWNLVFLCIKTKRFGDATKLLEDDQAFNPEGPLPWKLRSLLYWEQGEKERSVASWQQAVLLEEKQHGPEHPQVAQARYEWARALRMSGRFEEAAPVFAGSLDATLNWLETQLPTMSEAGRLRLLEVSADPGEYLRTLARAPSASSDQAYARYLRWKGMATRLQSASLELAPLISDPEVQELRTNIQKVARHLSQQVLLPLDQQSPQHSLRIANLRQERLGLERGLNRRLGTAQALHTPDLARVQAALPADSVLLDFHVGTHVHAWVLARNGEPRLISLGGAKEIRAAMQSLLESAGVRGGKPLSEGAADPGMEFQRRFWEPLSEVVGDAATVFVSPDGFLCELPLGVVPEEDGGFLLEKHRFVYLSDATRLIRPQRAVKIAQGPMLGIGGINYFRRDEAPPQAVAEDISTRSRIGSNWISLPATRVELQTLRDLHDFVLEWDSPLDVLEGRAATEEAARARLPGHRYLHIATHGYFEPATLPSLLLDAERKQAEARIGEQIHATGLLPGLLSGLVFAGVNGAPDPTRDDGYLSAEEIQHLDLSACDLVVLSACETALGSARAGEGLMSLRRSFEVAGADTVISSLWKVDDQATAELMKDFYTNLWETGMNRGEALHQAKLRLLRRNRIENGGDARPSTWGAFVLSGDWE